MYCLAVAVRLLTREVVIIIDLYVSSMLEICHLVNLKESITKCWSVYIIKLIIYVSTAFLY